MSKPEWVAGAKGYSVDTVLRVRDRIVAAMSPFEGTILDEDRVVPVTEALQQVMPSRCRNEEALRGTVVSLLRELLTNSAISVFSHRVAGNMDRLAINRPVRPFVCVRTPVVLPAQVEEVQPLVRRGVRAAAFTVKIMAGPACPEVGRRVFNTSIVAILSTRFGFSEPVNGRSRRESIRPYTDPRQFVGLRFQVELGVSQPGDPLQLGRISVPPGLLAYNHRLLDMRLRVRPGYVCPQGRPSDFPCHRCPVGYRTCQAATHKDDMERRPCPKCRRESLFAKPGDTKCLDCRQL